MMPVQAQPEPSSFDLLVRQKASKYKLPPPPVPASYWKNKEKWRKVLPDLFSLYGRICAFSSFRIERVTGSKGVEHFKPKGRYPGLAYEWSNYRLVCGLMNGRKLDFEDVIDPFHIPLNTFDLVPTSGEIIVHHDCPAELQGLAQSTITRLQLNCAECSAKRREHVALFQLHSPKIEPADSPFIHHCLTQQGLL